MHIKTTLAALLVYSLALPVLAQPAPAIPAASASQSASAAPARNPSATPGIDQRIVNQEKRIDQGVKSGALTAPEATRLEKREDRIKADTAAAKADGVVTKQERTQLQGELSQQSRTIHRAKHDRQHQGKGRHRGR